MVGGSGIVAAGQPAFQARPEAAHRTARGKGERALRQLASKGSKRAEESIERAQGVLEVLKLTKADLKAPTELLRAAREKLRAREFSEAEALAARSESLAALLEERYEKAKEVLAIAREQVGNLDRLGLDSTRLEDAIRRARRAARQSVREGEVTVPDYETSRQILGTASAEAREVLLKSEEASNAVFMAEIALEALREMDTPMDSDVFYRGIIMDIENRFVRATELLALGNLDAGLEVAKGVEQAATHMRSDYVACTTIADRTEAVLQTLRADGAVLPPSARSLEDGRSLLHQGRIVEAKEVLERAHREVSSVSSHYHKAVEGMEEIDRRVAQLRGEGSRFEATDEALRKARKALEDGRYATVLALLDEATQHIRKREEIHANLARAIRDAREKLHELKNRGLDRAEDVEEMLGRAEREFEHGDYVNSSEDLKIATLLIGPASRSLIRARRPSDAREP